MRGGTYYTHLKMLDVTMHVIKNNFEKAEFLFHE